MTKTIYTMQQGLGLILDADEKESDFILPMGVMLHGEELRAGDYTTLDGYFEVPLRFVGVMTDEDHVEMIFQAGDDTDLFGSRKYYYRVYWISENRIVNCYSIGSARDFNWIDNHWK